MKQPNNKGQKGEYQFVITNGYNLRDKLQDFPWGVAAINSKLLVAYMKDEQLVGVCAIRGSLNYLCLYVLDSARMKGIGNLLLVKLIFVATARHIPFLSLIVATENRPAVHLYEKYGFKRIADYDSYLGDEKFENKIMALRLSAKKSFFFFWFFGVISIVPRKVLSLAVEFSKGKL